MEVILQQDIKGLGYKNDTVSVKPGYGRNYLIPQGFAILANSSYRKMNDELIKQVAHKAEKLKNDAQEIADSIGNLTLEIGAKAGENGKIFGSITANQISEALKKKGFEIDRKKISLDTQVKEIGEYTATIDFHREVQHQIGLNVIAE